MPELSAAEAASMTLPSLREARMHCRRQLELYRLRAGTPRVDGDEEAALRAQVHVLTEELIARYAADPTLVDSLIDPAYPRKVIVSSDPESSAP